MAHFFADNENYSDFIYDDDYRSYFIRRRQVSGDYRFGRMQGKRFRAHARRVLRRVNGFLKNMIEAIANSKMRRIQRELDLRGIRFDRTSNNWVGRNPDRTGVGED